MTIRPYSQKSVFDLEAIFKLSSSDAVELRRLSGELRFRNTQRARSLAAKVEDALTGLATNNQVEANNSDASAGHPRMVQVSDPGIAETMETAMDDDFELDPLPSFPHSGNANDPQAILAAWIAIEALSPQSYKRPEDMVSRDRSRVALLEQGIPWGAHARSKPRSC